MKIFAVGMNYIQHNKELDGALYKPERPVIFTKADSALLKDHKPFFVPDWSLFRTAVITPYPEKNKNMTTTSWPNSHPV